MQRTLHKLRKKRAGSRGNCNLTVQTSGDGSESAPVTPRNVPSSSRHGAADASDEYYSPSLYNILSILSDHSYDAEVRHRPKLP